MADNLSNERRETDAKNDQNIKSVKSIIRIYVDVILKGENRGVRFFFRKKKRNYYTRRKWKKRERWDSERKCNERKGKVERIEYQ